jgi:hypothetical protein
MLRIGNPSLAYVCRAYDSSVTRAFTPLHQYISANATTHEPKGIRNPMSDESSPKGTHERTCIMVNNLTDPQTDKASGNPEAAICVQKSSAQRVLQFTLFNAASCVLHRPVYRVIHRLQLCFFSFIYDSIKVCLEWVPKHHIAGKAGR